MKISVLNLVPLRKGENFATAMANMVELGKTLENLGYHRYWVAEHHNSKGLASSATVLLMQHILSHTQSIRVGSGGIMLPNHSPYLVAEQFGTLATLYPNRIDLGLGRAPGTDMATAKAIRRHGGKYFDFGQEIAEIQGYFAGTNPVQAYPADGLEMPIYILGSTPDSARLAAKMGLPYAFASHFAPAHLEEAVHTYKAQFQPSQYLDKPYVMIGANVVLAGTQEEAQGLFTTQLQAVLSIISNGPPFLQPPLKDEEALWENLVEVKYVPHFGPIAFDKEALLYREKEIVRQMTGYSFVGTKESVSKALQAQKEKLGFDEIIAVSYIYDKSLEAKSYALLAEVAGDL